MIRAKTKTHFSLFVCSFVTVHIFMLSRATSRVLSLHSSSSSSSIIARGTLWSPSMHGVRLLSSQQPPQQEPQQQASTPQNGNQNPNQHPQKNNTPGEEDRDGAKRLYIASLGVALFGTVLLGYNYRQHLFPARRATSEESVVSTGRVKIGGPFSLMGMDGKPITEKILDGKFTLVYFGFTNCPVICPAELDKITEVYQLLDTVKGLPELHTLFISCDPDRDSPQVIKKFLSVWDPRIYGATGPMDEIRRLAKSYRVYFSKGPADKNNDYNVDHTIIVYLMGPDGGFLKHYSTATTASELAADVARRMNDYRHTGKL